MKILCSCKTCKTTRDFAFTPGQTPPSCACGKETFSFATDRFLKDETLNQCPLCGAAHVYRQKDFNRNLGVALIVLGVFLSYWTYGTSLVVVTLLDWLLIRRVKELGVCYQCNAQFRDSGAIAKLETFNLSLHDYYKNLS